MSPLNEYDLIWLIPMMLVVITLLIPARYDPSIRFKEWLERDK